MRIKGQLCTMKKEKKDTPVSAPTKSPFLFEKEIGHCAGTHILCGQWSNNCVVEIFPEDDSN